jgi:alpha-glucosidase
MIFILPAKQTLKRLAVMSILSLPGYAEPLARTVGPVPKEWGLDPFYTKAIQADITRISASDVVCDEALINMANVIETLLSKTKTNHPAIHNMLSEKKHRFAIIGTKQNTLDIPEYRHLSKKGFGWTRGLGGTVWCPLSSCGEENALNLGKPEDRYGDENIGVHEFAHGIFNIGIQFGDPALFQKIKETYTRARAKGLWEKTYGGSNFDEYFSICTQCWFSVMVATPDGKPNGTKNHVHSRETLKEYDPDMYAIMEALYTTNSLPAPWQRTFK